MKLYEIGHEIRELIAETEESGGELSPEQAAKLTALEMAFEKKAEAVAAVVCELEAQEEAIAREAKRLADRARARRTRAEGLKAYLLIELQWRGIRKIAGEILDIRLQRSAPAVQVVNEKAIPGEFWVQPPPELSKSKLAAALKTGAEVPGALLVQREHVRIV